MIAAVLSLAALQAAAPATQAPPDAGAAAPPVEVPAFDGLADGLTRMQLAVGEGRTEVALALADALLAPDPWSRLRTELEGGTAWLRAGFDALEPLAGALGFGGPGAAARAEVHYAAGVALDRAGRGPDAQERFRTALALAGPGELRLDAGYDVGAIALGLAEGLREAQRHPPAQLAPGATGGAAAQADPRLELDRLEAAYRAAKAELVQRLRADWRDADTRANLELVQRRLREIEEQREKLEQQEEQQRRQQQQPSDQQQPQDSESQDRQPSESDQPQDAQPSEGARPEPKEGEEQTEPQDRKPEEQQKPEEQPGEPAEPAEPPAPGEEQPEAQPDATPLEERVLTREELMRLLGRLEEIEKEGRAIQARLREVRRARAEKDW